MRFVKFAVLLAAAAPAWAVPINYTFNLTTPASSAATILVSSVEDPLVQIQLSAVAGTVAIDAAGAGVLATLADTLDIEGGDRLIFTPVSFFGPYTFVSAIFGNVDTGGGNSGDQAVVYTDGVAGPTITLPGSLGVYNSGAGFNSTVAFQNSDGNDDFRVRQIVIRGDVERPPSAVPEPTALTLMGAGLVGLAWLRRRR